ncbi:MAG TPA: prenyltransferase/squalene oxidase repeat-containing protein [Thermoplasmata archaeon]|nr:prenyltransferase/squalene oxidase repeat-containing protein [Thermoplasmata archaeon]
MSSNSVIGWLLAGGDPSVRYHVLRDLEGRPDSDPDLRAARQEIGQKGWAAEILKLQLPEGQWASPGTTSAELYRPKYVSSNWCLLFLSELGASRADPRVARGAELLLSRYSEPSGGDMGGPDSEVCVTGNAVRMLTRFGYGDDPRVRRAIDWLLATQKEDGGWHCFPSETGTLDGWEALAAFASIPPDHRSEAMRRSIDRGLEFFLNRALMHEGPEPYAPWLRLHFPTHYYYDVLVGLEIVTALGRGDDRRLAPALAWLESKRDASGRWPLDALQPDMELTEQEVEEGIRVPYCPLGFEVPGHPSRWITLRALTVLKRVGRA